MKPVLRNIGGVLAGFVVAGLIPMVVESINGRVHYPGLAMATSLVVMAGSTLGARLACQSNA